MKKITIVIYFTNQETWTIQDVIFYSWEDEKFLSIDTTKGKVIVMLANVNGFEVKEGLH